MPAAPTTRRRRILAGVAGLTVGLGACLAVPTASAAPTNLTIGQTATFSRVRVTVTASDRASDSYFYGAKVKVCVRSVPAGTTRMRLSWDPWTIAAAGHPVRPGTFEEGSDPWGSQQAPQSRTYAVGQCMTGYVPFAVGGRAAVTSIGYANSMGNHASWRVTNGASPQRALGSTATFPHFSVQVTHTAQDEGGFRAYVRTCVRSRPAGSSGGRTRLSWDPYVANAGTHFGFVPYVYDASHTWSHLYPKTGQYAVGQCAEGWVPFEGVDTSLHVDRLAYRNSLGNQAFWTAAP